MSDYIPDVESKLRKLTQAERATIEEVIEKDKKLLLEERIRLG